MFKITVNFRDRSKDWYAKTYHYDQSGAALHMRLSDAAEVIIPMTNVEFITVIQS